MDLIGLLFHFQFPTIFCSFFRGSVWITVIFISEGECNSAGKGSIFQLTLRGSWCACIARCLHPAEFHFCMARGYITTLQVFRISISYRTSFSLSPALLRNEARDYRFLGESGSAGLVCTRFAPRTAKSDTRVCGGEGGEGEQEGRGGGRRGFGRDVTRVGMTAVRRGTTSSRAASTPATPPAGSPRAPRQSAPIWRRRRRGRRRGRAALLVCARPEALAVERGAVRRSSWPSPRCALPCRQESHNAARVSPSCFLLVVEEEETLASSCRARLQCWRGAAARPKAASRRPRSTPSPPRRRAAAAHCCAHCSHAARLRLPAAGNSVYRGGGAVLRGAGAESEAQPRGRRRWGCSGKDFRLHGCGGVVWRRRCGGEGV